VTKGELADFIGASVPTPEQLHALVLAEDAISASILGDDRVVFNIKGTSIGWSSP